MDFNQGWKQCPRGHWYDPSKVSSCPQCAEEGGGARMEGYGATEPVSGVAAPPPAAGGFGGYGATEPSGGFGGVPDFDRPSASGGYTSGDSIPDYGSSFGETMPPPNGSGFTRPGMETGFQMDEIGATEPVFVNQVHGFSPVVGWLVCIEGPDRGRDYRIHAGYNSIGRASHMDICITGDQKISREKHAMIAFDPDEKLFYFGPVDGKNLVKLNNKLVMMPNELHGYDVVTIGSSKLMFVPFCGDRFSWEDE